MHIYSRHIFRKFINEGQIICCPWTNNMIRRVEKKIEN